MKNAQACVKEINSFFVKSLTVLRTKMQYRRDIDYPTVRRGQLHFWQQ